MAIKPKRSNAKRSDRPNPREDRNQSRSDFPVKLVAENGHRVERAKKIEILPRNVAQEAYLDMLNDESKAIVFAMGPAGTGKSMLATVYALQQLKAGYIKKIVITRPAISTDESHGFLPGTLTEKLAPWCRPIIDILKEYFSVPEVDRMIADEIIELGAIGMLRGRTFKDCIVILDEAQSATANQMKMVLTRIGDRSRIFVTGDIQQHERGFEDNGLKDFVARLENHKSNSIGICRFGKCDIERHPVIDEVLTLYGE